MIWCKRLLLGQRFYFRSLISINSCWKFKAQLKVWCFNGWNQVFVFPSYVTFAQSTQGSGIFHPQCSKHVRQANIICIWGSFRVSCSVLYDWIFNTSAGDEPLQQEAASSSPVGAYYSSLVAVLEPAVSSWEKSLEETQIPGQSWCLAPV